MQKGDRAICPICGQEYICKSSRSRACSRNCQSTLWNREHTQVHDVNCAVCGKAFQTTDSKVKYCSKFCAEEANSQNKREYMRRAAVVREVACAECGKIFTTTSRYVKLCSAECRAVRASRLRVLAPKPCEICGKEFTPKSSSAKYCCDECKKEAQRRANSKRIEESAPMHKVIARLNRPAKRWASMTWDEVIRENKYYGFSYSDSQIRARNGTLPEDYGLKRKRC